ncbi:hypothetical protein EG328_012058 [Venturia inaequalis]|uniref:Uncharacterized protein n=1 Tax=Venturia inaequalis TaxID=5025 RepID=A0A8H3U6N2_VENIN|nr:hypothetical protein EG328_012058 [Venturia inaequalis]KAE9964138.1 hypothetical protein EG327_001064 [Venturia inaequalis]
MGKPSIKDHPYYAEVLTTVLLGFGFLGPELTAAVAIVAHGWLSWEPTASGFEFAITRSLPTLSPTIQDDCPNVHIGLASSQDAPPTLDHQLGPEIAEQVLDEFDYFQELLEPQLLTPRNTIVIPSLNVAQVFLVPEQMKSNEISESPANQTLTELVYMPQIIESELDLENCNEVTELLQVKSKVSELEDKLLMVRCELKISQTRLDEQDKSEQKSRARAVEVEKKNGNLNNLLDNRLAETRELKTELRALRTQTASGPLPVPNKILRHPLDLQAKFTRCHKVDCGQNLEGLPVEIEQQLINAKYCGFTLEAEEGEIQYILVDIEEPTSMYCLPLHNQILWTMGGDHPDGYALQPGITMDDLVPEVREKFRYEVGFGDMFSRCIVRSTKPLVHVKFDYTMLGNDSEFPSTMKEHLECQNMTDLQLDALAPWAHYHRKHLGLKAPLLIVNKQCSPWAALRACEGLPVVDGCTGEQSLVRNGDRNCWEFHVIHISEGERVELLVDDVAAYLAEAQPWHDSEQVFLPDGTWDIDPVIPETYLHSNEHVKELGVTRGSDGQNWFTPTCPEWAHLQSKWEDSKHRSTEAQHHVRDSIDPVHFYRQRMNIVSTNLFDQVEEDRDLALADGRSFHASQFSSEAFASGSDIDCVCEFGQPDYMCIPCSVKAVDCFWQKYAGSNCQNWVETLPYDSIGRAEDGAPISEWKGEIAFKFAEAADTAGHDVSFMELEATLKRR